MRPWLKYTRRVAIIIAAALATSGTASAANYEFKVVRAPMDGAAQSVELIDTATGQPVPNAKIYVVHTFYGPHQKGALNIRRVFVPLRDHLSGNCAHPPSESPTARELTVMAKVPGEFWTIWGTVDLGDGSPRAQAATSRRIR